MRITYSAVASTAALAIAMSTGAYAVTQLPKNSVGAAQIRTNAVSTKEVKNRSLKAADLKKGQAAKALAGTPMGGDLSGVFPNPSVTGVMKGSRLTAALALPPGGPFQNLFSLPVLGPLEVRCTPGPGGGRGLEVRISNPTSGWVEVVIQAASDAISTDYTVTEQIPAGTTRTVLFESDPLTSVARALHLAVVKGAPAAIVDLYASTRTIGDQDCRVLAEARLP
jgi:hypothetical protein